MYRVYNWKGNDKKNDKTITIKIYVKFTHTR